MRSAFGKVNLMHNHVLPWIDRPLVSTNLVGGEDGIDEAILLLLAGASIVLLSFTSPPEIFWQPGLGPALNSSRFHPCWAACGITKLSKAPSNSFPTLRIGEHGNLYCWTWLLSPDPGAIETA
jgi:hypothetical protein